MQRVSTYLMKVRVFFTRKRIIWTAVILVVILFGWLVFFRKSSPKNIQTAIVKKQDIEKTVLTTGQVVSSTDLDLSFQGAGVVRRVNVKEGDKVYEGQVLATLDESTALANLESAQASYNKIKAAATAQDIAVSQAARDGAATALQNAKQNLLNQINQSFTDANVAVLSSTNILFSNPQSNSPQFSINGTVQVNNQDITAINSSRVAINDTLSKWQVEITTVTDSNINQVVLDSLTNLSQVSKYLGDVVKILTVDTQVTFGGSQSTITSYTSAVTTSKATVDASYNTLNSYNQAVKNAVNSLAQAQASLDLKQAPARQEDVDIAKAQVDIAQAALNNTIVYAPISGTITQVDVKLGEQSTPGKEVVKMLNVNELHAEAHVSEADIASVLVGQDVDMTFDALGPDRHFQSKVLTVNPASTIVSGVVDYKVTATLPNIPDIKPGMTANMTILVAKKATVLAAPSSAVVNHDNQKFIKVIDDPNKKTYHEVQVSTGLEADGGLVEITSGLTENEEVVTFIK